MCSLTSKRLLGRLKDAEMAARTRDEGARAVAEEDVRRSTVRARQQTCRGPPGTDKTHQSERGSTPGSPLGSKPMSFVSLVTAKSIDFLDETAWEATAKRRKARMRKSLSPTSVSANSQAHKHRTLGIKMEAHGTGWSITDSGVHSDKIHEGDLFLQLTSSLLPPPCSRQVMSFLFHMCECTRECSGY